MDPMFYSPESKLFGITIFVSVVGFQIIYILLQWFYIRRIDYLYYIAYMVSMVIYGLSQFEEFLPFRLFSVFTDQSVLYTGHSLPFFSIFLYYRFSRTFLNLPETRRKLNKWICRLEYYILGFGLVSPILLLSGVSPETEIIIFVIICVILITASTHVLIVFFRKSNPFSRFAVAGAAFLVIGSLLNIICILCDDNGIFIPFDPYLPLLICVIAELLTFTTGLSYKTRLMEFEKSEAEKTLLQEAQKKQKLEIELLQLRTNLARDLHDEIGSGLTKISLLGEVIRRDGEIKDGKLEKIITSAKEMVDGMDEMIWSLNTPNDRLENLIYFLRRYAVEYFEHSNLKLTVEIPEHISNTEVTSDYRRNLLMILKEAFNNAIKHSKGNAIRVKIDLADEHLKISIRDNGVGIDDTGNSLRNGLKNMRSRMKYMNGTIDITNDNGTLINLDMPLSILQYYPQG